jgi:hypothetical protein
MTGTIDVFFVYAQTDEPLLKVLENHLSNLRRQGYITSLRDQRVLPGQEWEQEALWRLHRAHLIVLLISADFLAADYTHEIEFQKAIERHERGDAVVVPVILKPVDWKHGPLQKLRALPEGERAITA